MDDSMHLFLDTNTLLHYPPIKDVDWKAVCGCATVRLVLCLQVVHELDEKKDDSRLGNRASRAIKDIKAVRSARGAIREGVTLVVFNYEIRTSDFPATLSSDSKDDRIVHSVKKYLEDHPGVRVAVYTEDMGMSLRCEANAVAVVEPDPTRRLENPQDELTKKYRQAISELNGLKNRLPAFSVRVAPTNTDPIESKNEYELSETWQTVDAQAELKKIKRAYPKRHAPSEHPFVSSTLALGSLVSQEDWEQYDEQLDDFYAGYEVYLQRLNVWVETVARIIRFDLWLGNTGSSPAEDVDLLLVLPTCLKWVAESSSNAAKALHRPEPPKPPEKPKLRHHFDSLALPALPNITPLTGQIERMLAQRDRDAVEVNRIDDGFLIQAKLKRLKHGQTRILGTFAAVFGNWSEVGPFEVAFTISTSEIPEEIHGKVPFIVRRK